MFVVVGGCGAAVMSGAARRHQTTALVRWVFAQRGLHDGNSISREYRQDAATQDCTSLTYGEVDERSFLTILELVKPQPGEHFVDLGSGRGKVSGRDVASEPFALSSSDNLF
jgi:Histone methylation protein DOT1